MELVVFQSHAGSIEAVILAAGAIINYFLFQSHAGSIEATACTVSTLGKTHGFNPTLVRLRPLAEFVRSGNMTGFNPTLVRLRQLHDGAPDAWIHCFNPTLVRLRPYFAGNGQGRH